MRLLKQDLANAKILWEYLRIEQALRPADLLLVCGGDDPSVGPRAAELFHLGLAPSIIVSGGSTHVPPREDGAQADTEAEAIASYLTNRQVPEHRVVLEKRATNTSENFWFAAELLQSVGVSVKSCIVVTRPCAERRALATGRRRWPTVDLQITGARADFESYVVRAAMPAKVAIMMVGEVNRLNEYSRLGFLERQNVPQAVEQALAELSSAGFFEETGR
jgi:uncharacterized SAM-binding protein YcdF (DUF218 family)